MKDGIALRSSTEGSLTDWSYTPTSNQKYPALSANVVPVGMAKRDEIFRRRRERRLVSGG